MNRVIKNCGIQCSSRKFNIACTQFKVGHVTSLYFSNKFANGNKTVLDFIMH